ncbi:MAG TPA: DUF2508 family protein [Clostridia bacterium]|nr:DUF2508 family protein [Clostridia bacterium]
MEGAIAGVIQMTLNRKPEVSPEQQLICELEAVKQNLDTVSERFEYQSDPDLVEACIYEMQALTARYRYLTREARRLGLTKSALLSLRQI